MLLFQGINTDNRPQIVMHVDSSKSLSECINEQSDPFLIIYFNFIGKSCIEISSSGCPVSIDLDKDPIALNSACGFVSTSEATRLAIADLKERLGKRLPWIATLDCVALSQDEVTGEGLQKAILALLVSERQKLLARNADLSSRSATARRQFEHAQRTLTEMAQCLKLAAPDNVVTALEYLPVNGRKSAVEASGIGKSSCVQRLPISLRGLAAIHLFANKVETAAAASTIEVKLQSAEDKFTHAVWSVDLQAVGDDTIRLMLPRALDTLDLNPLLSLTGERRALRAIRLGAPHPDPSYCCAVGGKTALAAPLAFRLRTGLPGRIMTHDPSAFLPVATATVDLQKPTARTELVSALHAINGNISVNGGRELDAGSLSKVYQVSETPAGINFGIVYYWAEKSGVMVHPLVGVTTLGCVPRALGGAFQKVVAWMEITEDRCPASRSCRGRWQRRPLRF